mgnify:FL=1
MHTRDSLIKSSLASTLEFQIVAVKTEPKMEPENGGTGQYSLADLDGITDLLPIQTGEAKEENYKVIADFSDFKVDSVALNDLDFWDKGAERGQGGYVVTSKPGHLEARWEQQTR